MVWPPAEESTPGGIWGDGKLNVADDLPVKVATPGCPKYGETTSMPGIGPEKMRNTRFTGKTGS